MKMTSRLAALAIAVLLTAGIAPNIALAAGGTGLSTGKAALTTQTAVTVPSSGLTAASSFYLGTGQKAKFTAVAGKTYMGSVSSKFSWNASYYGIFTVLKDGKTLATKKVGLSLGDADERIWYESSFSYKPKVTGTYKVRFQFMDGSDEMESYEKTFKVKKVSALKSCKPTFDVELGYVKKTDTHHPMLSGLNGKTQIYRATKKTGKFKLLATTSKATYTDTKAKAGKEYWYKIRIVGKSGKKTYLSKLSAAKSEPLLYAPPKAPTITKTTSEDAGVVLEWKKTSSPFGCDYTVYRSEKESGGYEVVGRVREDYDGTLYAYDGGEISSESAFMDTTAEAGKTYYYKMSASYELKWNQKVATGAPVKVTT